MEKENQKKITSSKMEKFLKKIKEMPDIRESIPSEQKGKKEKFIQKILEDIGPY